MTFFVSAVSPDGQRFKILENGTWEKDGSVATGKIAFRSSCWGDSIEAVKNAEKAELLTEDPDYLAYKTTVAGLSAMFFFRFVDGRLVTGSYKIDEPHANNNAFLNDFESLKKLLQTKYGPASSSDVFWNNDLYQDNYAEWGMAISCGHVSFFDVWEDKETHLELQLTGDNYEVSLRLLYRSEALKCLADAHREKNLLDGL